MSVQSVQQSTTPPRPTTEQLRRLAIEAGKYLGKEAGETLPIHELRLQAEANGYTEKEASELLQSEGLTSETTVTIPKQVDLFGKLWHVDNVGKNNQDESEPLDVDDIYGLHEPIAASAGEVDDSRYLDASGNPLTATDAIGSYIERRHGENVSAKNHGYYKTRQHTAKKQYAKGKEMDRQLLTDYENPTTVLLSLRLSPGSESRLSLLHGLHSAIEPTLGQIRYRLVEAPDAPLSSDEYEYMAVVAGTEGNATPHLHIYLWCDGDVSGDRFIPVVEKFVEKCPYAPDDMQGHKPGSDVISVRGNGDDSIPQRDGKPAESTGATYVLTQLPHLKPVDEMDLDELLHSVTVDAWDGRAFRRSQYTVWDDGPEPEEISAVEPTSSASEPFHASEGKGSATEETEVTDSSEEENASDNRFTFTAYNVGQTSQNERNKFDFG